MTTSEAIVCFERQCASGICTEADKVALAALREKKAREQAAPLTRENMEERKNQKPLTIAELKKMHGLPVWIADEEAWGIVNVDAYGQWSGKPFVTFFYKTVRCDYDIQKRKLKCYRYKLEEETV